MTQSERARLVVRVQPNARQSRLAGFDEGVLRVRIAAHPVEGKANEALIKFLSGCLDISKSRVTIERGSTGRTKTIAILGLSQSQVVKQLETLIWQENQ